MVVSMVLLHVLHERTRAFNQVWINCYETPWIVTNLLWIPPASKTEEDFRTAWPSANSVGSQKLIISCRMSASKCGWLMWCLGQKVKAQRGHSFSNQHDNVVNSVNSKSVFFGLKECELNEHDSNMDEVHYLNTPSSDAGLELPIVSGPDCNLQGQDNDHFKQFVGKSLQNFFSQLIWIYAVHWLNKQDSACWISPENQSFTNNQVSYIVLFPPKQGS